MSLLTGVHPRMASARAGRSLGRSGSSRQGCWGSSTGQTAVTVASIVVALSCSRVSEEFVAEQTPVDLTARVGSQLVIAVLGGGAMGAALAVRWATAGAEVALLGTDLDTPVLAAVRNGRAHPALGVTLHPALTYRSCDEWESVLAEADVVVVALSSAGLRDPVTIGARSARADATWVIATKGWQEDTLESPSEVVGSILGSRQRTVSLAGPALAAEVVAGAPTAFVFAAHDAQLGKRVARSLRSNTTATVVTDDVVGAETASAYKNVVAIAVGMCEGLSERFAQSALNRTFANGRAAVFAQGLTDMVRLVEAKGGRASTVLGLAGAGDLYVTCLGGRNGRFGRLVGAGATPEQALKAIGSTVEGTANTRAALALASKLMIDLPTARTVDILLREEIAGEEGFQRLLALFAMALSSIVPPST